MSLKHLKKSGSQTVSAQPELLVKPPVDLKSVDPDSLRTRLLKVLLAIAPDEQAAVRDRLLAGLAQAGVNISLSLLLLGIPAKTPRELTAADIATLIRFVQINSPQALPLITAQVTELLAASDEMKHGKHHSRLAA